MRSASLTFYPQPPPHPLKNQVNRVDEALEDNGWMRGDGGKKDHLHVPELLIHSYAPPPPVWSVNIGTERHTDEWRIG